MKREFDLCLVALAAELSSPSWLQTKFQEDETKVELYWRSEVFDNRVAYIDVVVQFEKTDDNTVISKVTFGAMMRVGSESAFQEYVKSAPLTEGAYEDHLEASGLAKNDDESQLGRILGLALKEWKPNETCPVHESKIILPIHYQLGGMAFDGDLEVQLRHRQALEPFLGETIRLSVTSSADACRSQPDAAVAMIPPSAKEVSETFSAWRKADRKRSSAAATSKSPKKKSSPSKKRKLNRVGKKKPGKSKFVDPDSL